MELGRHAILGASSGNPFQPQGRHQEFGTGKMIGLIPLGNRTRVIGNEIHLVGNAEEIEGADRVDKWTNIKLGR